MSLAQAAMMKTNNTFLQEALCGALLENDFHEALSLMELGADVLKRRQAAMDAAMVVMQASAVGKKLTFLSNAWKHRIMVESFSGFYLRRRIVFKVDETFHVEANGRIHGLWTSSDGEVYIGVATLAGFWPKDCN